MNEEEAVDTIAPPYSLAQVACNALVQSGLWCKQAWVCVRVCVCVCVCVCGWEYNNLTYLTLNTASTNPTQFTRQLHPCSRHPREIHSTLQIMTVINMAISTARGYQRHPMMKRSSSSSYLLLVTCHHSFWKPQSTACMHPAIRVCIRVAKMRLIGSCTMALGSR